MVRVLISITSRVDLAMSFCPNLRELVSQFKGYRDKTFPKAYQIYGINITFDKIMHKNSTKHFSTIY